MYFAPHLQPNGEGGFIVTFESTEARDDYLVHPEHIVVGERLAGLTDGGLAGILVFDMAV